MLEWTPDMSVNIAQIDDQHKLLIATLNELDACLKAGKPHAELLSQAIAQSLHHFQSEEALMGRYGYPGAAIHRSAHRRLVRQAQEISKTPENGAILSGLVGFISQWLKEHIMHCDKEYVQFLNDKGVR